MPSVKEEALEGSKVIYRYLFFSTRTEPKYYEQILGRFHSEFNLHNLCYTLKIPEEYSYIVEYRLPTTKRWCCYFQK